MTVDEIIACTTALPGVALLTASEENGAPEVAWGDSFFYYDPDGDPGNRRMPFATIVTKDYDGFDTESALNRPGVFRVNMAVGRTARAELAGGGDGTDPTALDTLIPHPVYASQGWVAVLNPGEETTELTRTLLTDAHARAVSRHARRRATG